MRNSYVSSRRGLTLFELLLAFFSLFLLAGIMIPALNKARSSAQQAKDATQIRAIHQSMIAWGHDNRDWYPLPSSHDRAALTIPGIDPANRDQMLSMDTTRNIFSILIWNMYVGPEIFVSPVELGPIEVFADYQYEEPTGARIPERALWDPAFRGTPGDDVVGDRGEMGFGHLSYAHAMPFGKRKNNYWTNNFNSLAPALSNRGPSYAPDGDGPGFTWKLLDASQVPAGPLYFRPVGASSNTLGMHGDKSSWSGHLGFNDNHVRYESSPAPESVRFTFRDLPAAFRDQPDNIFENESDADRRPQSRERIVQAGSDNTNVYLRAYSKAMVNGFEVRISPFFD